jgi:hypothetical protein
MCFVFSKTILPLAQNKISYTVSNGFCYKSCCFIALLFPRQSCNCDESDRLAEPNKVKLTATLLQNIGFSQNM